MRCNCENLHCPVCKGQGCKETAGHMRAMMIGAMCDACAQHMPSQYMLTEVEPGVYEPDLGCENVAQHRQDCVNAGTHNTNTYDGYCETCGHK